MSINTDNKIQVDKYIAEHPESKLDKTFPISLKGKKKDLRMYQIPIEILFYNIKNGRFAAEYRELVKREGGHLQPENPDDATKIQELLLDLDKSETIRTYNDIEVRGQWNCGVITEDGYVIDGNRRMAILSKLYDDTGEEKWKFIEVAKLDEPISPEDLWSLEAGIQLGKDEIVRYGPVNELLKLREGIDAGLSPESIVKILYGYDKPEEITIKLDRLRLIDQYLKFNGTPEKYSQVNNKVEHFINLQNIIQECRDVGYDPNRVTKIIKVAFELIRESIPHLELRKIRRMIEFDVPDSISEIEKAADQIKPHTPKKQSSGQLIESETEKIIDEFEESESEQSVTMTHFINAVDALDVKNNDGKELQLLNRAEKNLRPLLDYTGSELSTQEAKQIIEKIAKYAQQLKEKYT